MPSRGRGRRATMAMAVPVPQNSPHGSGLRPLDEFKGGSHMSTRQKQIESYELGREIGEIGYAHDITANTVAVCDIRSVQKVGNEVVTTTDLRVKRVTDAFVGPRGGVKELMRRHALNLRYAGEVYLVGTPVQGSDDSDTGLLFEFLSMQEIIKDVVTGEVKRNAENKGAKSFDDPSGTYIARDWYSDPAFSGLPDCAMFRVLPVLRQLAALQQVTESVIKSRLAADVILIPDGMTFVSPNQEDDPDNLDPNDPDAIEEFTAALLEHLSTPITDRRSASALVPLVWRGSPDDIKAVKMLGIAKDIGEWAALLRAELLLRAARIIEIPPEMVQGKGGVNHWGNIYIDQDFVSKHVVPLGDHMMEFDTASYLRPMLVAFEGMSEEEAATFAWEFDPSNVEARADAGVTAIQLWRERVINRKAVATNTGMKETDLMSEEEIAVELLRDICAQYPQYLALYRKYIPGMEDMEPDQAALPAPRSLVPVPNNDLPDDPGKGGDAPTEEPQKQDAAAEIADGASWFLLRAVERLGATVYAEGGNKPALPDELILDLELQPVRDVFMQVARRKGLCRDELMLGRVAAEFSQAVAISATSTGIADRVDPAIALEHVLALTQ